ncbi:MAG: SAM-dependent methyltransferase [Hydrogenophaga sp.]|uniref:SAM-dependent methyltransferase n=1 Tax=Hydrogenophaga sp. TaxID=1904254 RepID=UPI00257B3A70|nr:SAM-dependent methyltransferase [Hydrogenophaga sp.]MBL0945415.1 SAM-dependent methyltransferase [Hydrogenophaga sp.]
MTPGRLYLVPTPLDFGAEPQALAQALPAETIATAARLTHWIAENAKSARAFLKRVDGLSPLAAPLQAQQISELPRQAHKQGDHNGHALDAAAKALLAPALQGHDIGLLSEAGMPAVADPGSSVVRAAHALGLPVLPLVGPVSLMLALAASGLNGQHFAFVGYVPQDAAARAKRLRELDASAARTGQTQMLIETPYRNAALLQALLEQLSPASRLAVACGLGLPQQSVRSAPVAQWRQHPGWREGLPLSLPAVFLFGP